MTERQARDLLLSLKWQRAKMCNRMRKKQRENTSEYTKRAAEGRFEGMCKAYEVAVSLLQQEQNIDLPDFEGL